MSIHKINQITLVRKPTEVSISFCSNNFNYLWFIDDECNMRENVSEISEEQFNNIVSEHTEYFNKYFN